MNKNESEYLVEAPGTAREASVPAYKLKVLAGRHAGAVMPLLPGRHSLGQDEECDLIFLDDAFLGGRVILDVSGASLRLEATGQVKAAVDGKPVTSEPQVLENFQVVEVGATSFALGPVEGPWPGDAASQPEDTGENPPPETESAPAETPSAEPAVPSPGESRKGRRVLAIGIAAGLFVLLSVAIAVLVLRPKPDPMGAIRSVIVDMGLGEIKVEDTGEDFLVNGFVKTEEQKAAFASRLSQLGLPIRTRILSAEEIITSIQGVIELYQMDFLIEIAPWGKVTMVGVNDDQAMLKELLESVRQGAQSEVKVDGRFLATGVVIPYVTRLLAAKGLVHKVRLEAHRGRLQGVLVKNQMDDAEMAAWKTIKDSFQATFGMEIEEKWTDKLSPTLAKFAAANQELDAELLGVTPGEMGYVTLKNGRKYFEGARLKSGPFIKDISRERLILAIGAVEEPYYLKKGKR